MIDRGTNFYLLGHLYCTFLLSLLEFFSLNFQFSRHLVMPPIVFYIELAGKNVDKKLGVHFDGIILDIPLNNQKNLNHHIKHSGVLKNCTKLIEKVTQSIIVESTPC